ncbi:BLUF domain-containing protein [Flammeovirga yaeyamensis]|uniref:BLUF domain-containing protein n=1 Tax=Flammeovirga yaeyamensis TaxID=367791 RepID=A0AAX1NA60_9BACT|nr:MULTISPECIES: BLUF domain-containing protein [Flammeovirga]ANQ49228.1 BLUF domain-containing protein [Flammeovirga sp. MY04]MBB3697909.1 hypothetical protein [Flammeovirga yaeyamensis]NMF35736.1 BLUF domain-containing protein [Flammeovirga yaeyamensis]QWG03311.1 BLUF domain-containing protein [Flammeovirga yaeyamensis]
MIYSYIYSSKSKNAFEIDDLLQLQYDAEKNNSVHNITGYLTYKNDIFIQYIEGDEDQIKQLIKNLHKDDRHQIINEFVLPNRKERLFKNWNMRYIEYNNLIEIGFHELLDAVFFTIDNRLFSNSEVSSKINRMLLKVAEYY